MRPPSRLGDFRIYLEGPSASFLHVISGFANRQGELQLEKQDILL